jgi:tetratricopeptide (TPR) repeat protein
MTDSQKNLLYRALFFTVVIFAVYYRTLGNQFVWDDLDVIVKNRLLEHFANLPRLLLYEDRTGEALTGYYRPLTYLSFLLDRTIWGLNPLGFNLTNLLLHVGVTLTFSQLLLTLFQREPLAWVAPLIFALHPVANEAVNFHAGGRNTLLSALFALLSLLFYVKRRHIPSVACFIAAIFSKEFPLLLPGIFLLYDLAVAKERPRWTRYLPYLAATACYLGIRSFAVSKGNLLKTLQLSDNLLMVPQIVVSYLKNMLLPVHLKVIYDVQPGPAALYTLVFLGLLGTLYAFRKRIELAGAALWFLLFLVPVCGILPLGAALMADRYAYFSLMGFSLAAGYLVCLLPKKGWAAVVVVICLGYAAVDLKRTAIWNNLLSLYTQMTLDAPQRSIGFTNVGMYYYERGDLVQAEKWLKESTTKKGIVIRDALQYLSATYWELEQYDQALAILNRMMQAEPENPQPYIMASKIYQAKGDAANAKLYRDKVLAKYPQLEQMMQGRLVTLCQEGEKLAGERKFAEAERKFKEALMMNPDFVPALIDMGGLQAEQGNPAKALQHFLKAQRLEPGNAAIYNNMALVYQMLGKPAEAQAAMQKFQEAEGKAQRP